VLPPRKFNPMLPHQHSVRVIQSSEMPDSIGPKSASAFAPKLTARETQVLRLLADGNTTKEIAAALGVSFKTAATHRVRIMEKFEVRDSVTLVRLAIRNHLIDP
jgi:DNA-binding NarL/FixJ family response regulator